MEVNTMEVIKVAPRGYCKGVVRAINMAKQCAIEYPNQPITILGMLVHNRYVMEALQEYHIQMIDDKTKTREELLDAIHEGVVIFTAHGISPAAVKKAKNKGLICVDASCPDVLKTQEIVKKQLMQGYEVIYIGKAHHPEAEAVCAISDHIHFIEPNTPLPVLDHTHIFVTNQTTMSMFDLQKVFALIKQTYPNAVFSEEICNATRIRQEAVANLQGQGIDALYVVGDASSNNSNRLAQIAKEHGIKNVYLIDDVKGIKEEQLAGLKKVAVTAGASTPTYLTNQVIQYLEEYTIGKETPEINISELLG